MARGWFVDGRAIATKVKNASLPSANQIKDGGASRECPNCHYLIDNSDVSHEWPGLPAGVKFDPSDVELLEHLAAKCEVENSKPHPFIDEFITTLEEDSGICCTHPENLPGSKKDGSSAHFFHRTRNAYASGQRKRRKIQNQQGLTNDQVRWHKTGKTKPVIENGVQKGCKKIMVLYRTSVKGSKPDKANWVMHQFHLGNDEDETDGQYVVSKIFYQLQKQTDQKPNSVVIEEASMIQTSPRTPKTYTPNPPRPEDSVSCNDGMDDYLLESPAQGAEVKDDMECPSWLAGESQSIDEFGIEDILLCNEVLDSRTNHDIPGIPSTSCVRDSNSALEAAEVSGSSGFADFENIELNTRHEFSLADLEFTSQDSIFDWISRN